VTICLQETFKTMTKVSQNKMRAATLLPPSSRM
jgi:hypothetical protein